MKNSAKKKLFRDLVKNQERLFFLRKRILNHFHRTKVVLVSKRKVYSGPFRGDICSLQTKISNLESLYRPEGRFLN